MITQRKGNSDDPRRLASAYLADLENLGILKCVKVHPQKYFVNERLLELLREFRV